MLPPTIARAWPACATSASEQTPSVQAASARRRWVRAAVCGRIGTFQQEREQKQEEEEPESISSMLARRPPRRPVSTRPVTRRTDREHGGQGRGACGPPRMA